MRKINYLLVAVFAFFLLSFNIQKDTKYFCLAQNFSDTVITVFKNGSKRIVCFDSSKQKLWKEKYDKQGKRKFRLEFASNGRVSRSINKKGEVRIHKNCGCF